MTKKENDILARDLVLAAFIVMKRQYESRDAGRAGKLQMFLNIHAGTHGDVKNIVAILNNPKSTVKLSDDQKRVYQRALDIVDSVSEPETGWVEPISLPEGNPLLTWAKVDLSNAPKEQIEELQRILRFEPNSGKYILAHDLPTTFFDGIKNESIPPTEQADNILARVTNESILTPAQEERIAAIAEQPKAKPGRKAKNPIEAATANAKNKGKACCN